MNDAGMTGRLRQLGIEIDNELRAVASWWLRHVIDIDRKDFVAQVANHNLPDPSQGKSLVLTSRILWFFSIAHRHDPRDEYEKAAQLSLDVLLRHFPDAEFGGMYWTLDRHDRPDSMKKQSYGLAFAIYGLTEHFLSFGDRAALDAAIDIARTLEERARDQRYGGYREALSRNWTPLSDSRLGENDANADKTMNTHLHILEAYTNLVRATGTDSWSQVLKDLVTTFVDNFVSPQGEHLTHYYSREWKTVPSGISFGHDIEASWLLWEAVSVLEDPQLIDSTRGPVLDLANAVIERGIDQFGAVSNEVSPDGRRNEERVWWVQAEAMVGFMNAWSMTGEQRYLDACCGIWEFIKRYQIDREYGEWLWYSRLDRDAHPVYKAGRWKGPYHNGRALIEMLNRLSESRPTVPAALADALSP